MSATIYVKSPHKSDAILALVQSSVNAEIATLELALEIANQRLKPFEEKYHVTSDYFMEHFAAEDLAGGDDEYVDWAGEYTLKQRLSQKIRQLREIDYGYSNIFQSN